jgi:hypothetical protein
VTESWVDGTLEAEVTVLTAAQERATARALVTRSRSVAYWLLLAWACLLAALVEWLAAASADDASASSAIPPSPVARDEL